MYWFNTLHGGLLTKYSYSRLLSGSVIRRETSDYKGIYNGYSYLLSYLDIIALIKEKRKESSLHEVILGNIPQRLYIDIDGKRTTLYESTPSIQDLIEEDYHIITPIVESIISVFRELYDQQLDVSDMIFFTSSNRNKISYHIVIDRVVRDYLEQKNFFTKVCTTLPDLVRGYVDINIYKSINSLRLPYSSKTDGSRVKTPFIFTLNGAKLSNHHGVLDRMYFYICYGMVTRVQGRHSLPQKVIEEPKVYKSIQLPNNVLEGVEAVIASNFQDDFEVSKVEGNLICLKRLQPSKCLTCGVEHEGENPFLVISTDFDGTPVVKFYCRRADRRYTIIGFVHQELEKKVETSKRTRLDLSSMITTNKAKSARPINPRDYF
jgi:hypothetical protein